MRGGLCDLYRVPQGEHLCAKLDFGQLHREWRADYSFFMMPFLAPPLPPQPRSSFSSRFALCMLFLPLPPSLPHWPSFDFRSRFPSTSLFYYLYRPLSSTPLPPLFLSFLPKSVVVLFLFLGERWREEISVLLRTMERARYILRNVYFLRDLGMGFGWLWFVGRVSAGLVGRGLVNVGCLGDLATGFFDATETGYFRRH